MPTTKSNPIIDEAVKHLGIWYFANREDEECVLGISQPIKIHGITHKLRVEVYEEE